MIGLQHCFPFFLKFKYFHCTSGRRRKGHGGREGLERGERSLGEGEGVERGERSLGEGGGVEGGGRDLGREGAINSAALVVCTSKGILNQYLLSEVLTIRVGLCT